MLQLLHLRNLPSLAWLSGKRWACVLSIVWLFCGWKFPPSRIARALAFNEMCWKTTLRHELRIWERSQPCRKSPPRINPAPLLIWVLVDVRASHVPPAERSFPPKATSKCTIEPMWKSGRLFVRLVAKPSSTCVFCKGMSAFIAGNGRRFVVFAESHFALNPT